MKLKRMQRQLGLLGGLLGIAWLLSGCTSTAMAGAGALSAMADAVAGNSLSKESQRRAVLQTDLRAYEDAQHPPHVESEAAYLAVVAQMQKQGLWFASLAHIDALESNWKASDRSKLLRADALRQTGNKEVSGILYRQLLGGQSAANALHGLGLLAAANGTFDEAIGHMQAAQKLAPTDALLLNDLGYALLHTQRAADAGLPLKQAAQLQPHNVRIQNNLALYLVLFAPPEEAVAWMNQSSMRADQRLRVLERAQAFNAPAAVTTVPIKALGAAAKPEERKDACAGCLIFEKQLISASPH